MRVWVKYPYAKKCILGLIPESPCSDVSTSTIICISRTSSNGLTIERLECRFCGHITADFSEKRGTDVSDFIVAKCWKSFCVTG